MVKPGRRPDVPHKTRILKVMLEAEDYLTVREIWEGIPEIPTTNPDTVTKRELRKLIEAGFVEEITRSEYAAINPHRVREIEKSKGPKPDYFYRLKTNLDAFKSLAKMFLKTEEELAFIHSRYAQEISAKEILSYVQDRFKVFLNEDDLRNVLKVVQLSPSALHFVLFSDTELFDTFFDDLQKLKDKVNQDTFSKLKAVINYQFFIGIQSGLVFDMLNNARNLFENTNVNRWVLGIETILYHGTEVLLSLESKGEVGIYEAGEKIRMGQIVALKPNVPS